LEILFAFWLRKAQDAITRPTMVATAIRSAVMPANIHSHHYQLMSVEKTTAPTGASGGQWYRYVIKSGNSVMSGIVSGTQKQVTAHAGKVIEQINTRNTWAKSKHEMGTWRKKGAAVEGGVKERDEG
jgi:hypothetical protein